MSSTDNESISSDESVIDLSESTENKKLKISNELLKEEIEDSKKDVEKKSSREGKENKKVVNKKIKKVVVKNSSKDDNFRNLRDNIYTLLYYNNKPYILTELCLQFKNNKKSEIEKVLIDLEEKNKITIKINGKTKIFYLNQLSLKFDQNIDSMKENYEKINENLKDLKNKNFLLNDKINGLKSEISTEQAIIEIKEMTEFLEKNKHIFDLKIIDKEEFKKRKDLLNSLKKSHTLRNNIFKRIVDDISDGIGIKRKEFLSNAGIEE